jgi:hypothetical protein
MIHKRRNKRNIQLIILRQLKHAVTAKNLSVKKNTANVMLLEINVHHLVNVKIVKTWLKYAINLEKN